MEKYIDVMKQAVELSGTMLEGLQHIQKLLGEGKFEETMYLFEDVISAFSTIDLSIVPVIEILDNHVINERSKKINRALEHVVSCYEVKSHIRVQEAMQFTLVPEVKKWKEELDKAFQPYIVS